MSLGYTKGKFWIPDARFQAYSERASYKALLRANNLARISTNVEFSYTAQRYMAEVKTIERFEKSAQLYVITHGNAYDPNPMAALCLALRKYEPLTVLQRACILEIECELLKEALQAARERERLDAKLLRTLELLEDTILKAAPLIYDHDKLPDQQSDEYDRWCHLILHGKPRDTQPPVDPFLEGIQNRKSVFDEDDDL